MFSFFLELYRDDSPELSWKRGKKVNGQTVCFFFGSKKIIKYFSWFDMQDAISLAFFKRVKTSSMVFFWEVGGCSVPKTFHKWKDDVVSSPVLVPVDWMRVGTFENEYLYSKLYPSNIQSKLQEEDEKTNLPDILYVLVWSIFFCEVSFFWRSILEK